MVSYGWERDHLRILLVGHVTRALLNQWVANNVNPRDMMCDLVFWPSNEICWMQIRLCADISYRSLFIVHNQTPLPHVSYMQAMP